MCTYLNSQRFEQQKKAEREISLKIFMKSPQFTTVEFRTSDDFEIRLEGSWAIPERSSAAELLHFCSTDLYAVGHVMHPDRLSVWELLGEKPWKVRRRKPNESLQFVLLCHRLSGKHTFQAKLLQQKPFGMMTKLTPKTTLQVGKELSSSRLQFCKSFYDEHSVL